MKAIFATLCVIWLPIFAVAQDSLPRVQGARMTDRLSPDPAFKLDLFSGRLGQISDFTLAEDGTIYSLDRATGRVFMLRDRKINGRMDTRRALPVRFDNPDAITIVEGRIFITDDVAIWELINFEIKRKIASLERAGAVDRKFIVPGQMPDHLILGLTAGDQSQLIQIEISSGRATLLADAPGILRGMTRVPGGAIWTMMETDDGTQIGVSLRNLGAALPLSLSQINVASPDLNTEVKAEPLNNHILAVEDGVRLSAYQLSLGQTQTPGRILLDGFKIKKRAAPWGEITAIATDRRGLFVADGINGDLWRLSPVPPSPDPSPSPISAGDTIPDP